MPKTRFSFLVTTLIVTCCSLASAGLMDFSSGVTINDSTKWTAGVDSTEQWYGSNYSVIDGAATLTQSSSGKTNKVAKSSNSVLVAFDLENAMIGDHLWNIDTIYNDYHTQYNYGQVYLLSDGQKIDLNKGIWNKKKGGVSIISKEYPRKGTGNLNVDTFGNSFKLTQKHIDSYDYVAFVFTGSKHTNQTLKFDNLSTSLYSDSRSAVPEPSTIAISSLGALMIFRRKKAEKGQ